MEQREVREKIESLFAREILGPGTPDEILDARPSDTYLTGILWPRGSNPDASQDEGNTDVASEEADAIDGGVPGYRAIRPCSFGMTFETDIDAVLEISLGTTAKYRAADVKTLTVDQRKNGDTLRWQRLPLNYRISVPAEGKTNHWRTSKFIGPDGKISTDADVVLDIHRRVSANGAVITITLINFATETSVELRDSTLLFQAELRATTSTPAIRPREAYPFADDDDQLTNLLLYRDSREFAAGHGIATEWSAPENARVREVRTSWIPRASVKSTSAAGHESMRSLLMRDPSPFAAAILGDFTRRSVTCKELDEFCQVYKEWITGLTTRKSIFSGRMAEAAERNEARCLATLKRMHQGVHVLSTNDTAWRAFAFANEAMDLQARFAARGRRAGPLVWRPFQLAFLLLVLPGLVEPTDPKNCRETMDLLWFPTGGGKTESYLALTAFAIFHRRLVNAPHRQAGGLDVLMRYTLRLLTIQQFQRAAALICACEMIRYRHPDQIGNAEISLGLYVGGEATPNRISDATEALQDEASGGRPRSTPRQLITCPVCSETLTVGAYEIDENDVRMQIRCPNSACQTGRLPMPILTVDEAIHARPPSLLIATADKFAQLPRNANMNRLFGTTGRRPQLIVQDELHLISGPLGSMAGLYEAATDLLCTDNGVRPKIIGSTATIGRAAHQVRALFDRDVLQFPPPGFEVSDAFFAVRDDESDDRVYRGLASAGRSPKFALQAMLAALLQAVHILREQHVPDATLDAYWTCVAYFNSLRELGGAHVLMLDDVRRQVAVLATRSHTRPRPLEEPPMELSSRVPSREIPELLQSLGSVLDVSNPYALRPPDAVLASNMISVGVDVPRLGLMAVAGQPKSTAEYIQATSRVGRGLPGLVITLYNFGRPRDLSHFEHFSGYHEAIYRSVEATSVTPWAPRARDKALHAVFAACVRQLVAGMLDEDAAARFSAADEAVRMIVAYLIQRAKNATAGATDAALQDELDEIEQDWERRAAAARAGNRRFRYWEKPAPFGNTLPHLLYSAESPRAAGGAWPAPNSLREVEPPTAFVLRRRT